MSETEQQPGGEPPPPEPQEASPEPREPPPQPEPGPAREAAEDERQSRYDKRLGLMRAQLSSAARERDEMAARLAALEQHMRQNGGQAPVPPDVQVQEHIRQEAQKLAEQERTKERIAAFHDAGRTEYPDWQRRCEDLQAMGVDAQIAALLVEMPSGAKVAAALSEDPEAIERIASLRGERARAVALGQYAERIAAQPTRAVSKAPPPPKPVQGRVAPEFNPYNPNHNTDQLVDYFSREAMRQQQQARRP
jgi:hypothetical protein